MLITGELHVHNIYNDVKQYIMDSHMTVRW